MGVNVYSVVAVVFRAGLQVPVILFMEVVGKAANESPEQIGSTWVNTGIMIGFTTIVNVAVGAQRTDVGLKV